MSKVVKKAIGQHKMIAQSICCLILFINYVFFLLLSLYCYITLLLFISSFVTMWYYNGTYGQTSHNGGFV